VQKQEAVRFGLYTADLRAGELKKGQDTIPLQNLPFRILAMLLREPGRVVTRGEIRQELWPADTFVDYERGISTAIGKLREALGDAAANSRFIETVGRRGYRFIAPVSSLVPATAVHSSISVSEPAEVLARPPEATRASGPQRIGVWRRAIFSGVAIAVIAALVFAFDSVSRTESPKILRMAQLTNSGRATSGRGLHSDGSRIYFMQKSGARWTLVQTSVAGGEVVPVAAPFPNTVLLAISPDRTEMLITTVTDYLGKMALWIAPLQGGSPQRVGDVMVDHAAWFPDGQRLLCSSDGEVFSVERDGTHRRHLFDVDGEPFRFSWKPDGTSFRFSVYHSNETGTLWQASADGSNVHPLLPGWNDSPNECCGTWSSDGRNFVFRSVQKGQEDLWLLHEPEAWPWAGKTKPVRLTNGPMSFSEPLFSTDGKKIFALGLQPHGFITRFDNKQREFVPFPLPPSAFDLDFSRDGEWVTYIAYPGLSLWRSRVDGSERLQLTAPPADALRPRWSRDGKQILFIRRLPKQYYSAYTVPAQGGAPQPVLEHDPFYREYVDWSPDGESVVIGVQPGMYPDAGITVVNLRTHRVSELRGSKGLRTPRWSRDGRYLAATSEDKKTVFLFDARLQQWKQVGTASFMYKIERDSSDLYYQDSRDPGQTVFRIDARTGKTERVFDCTKLLRDGAMRCAFEGRAPDGSFVFSVGSSWADLFAFEVELP
jgi:Tol biopolymer transport system component/DNA-binding winged helix-turn-helix (wHTH) protein